jgi:hypothetical protein
MIMKNEIAGYSIISSAEKKINGLINQLIKPFIFFIIMY